MTCRTIAQNSYLLSQHVRRPLRNVCMFTIVAGRVVQKLYISSQLVHNLFETSNISQSSWFFNYENINYYFHFSQFTTIEKNHMIRTTIGRRLRKTVRCRQCVGCRWAKRYDPDDSFGNVAESTREAAFAVHLCPMRHPNAGQAMP